MRKDIIEASKLHFKAHIEKHRINVENLLEKGVGVAEHPDIMETIEKELEIIAEYDDKLEILYLLELNTQPGMTETSLAPEQARFCEINMSNLVNTLICEAEWEN